MRYLTTLATVVLRVSAYDGIRVSKERLVFVELGSRALPVGEDFLPCDTGLNCKPARGGADDRSVSLVQRRGISEEPSLDLLGEEKRKVRCCV